LTGSPRRGKDGYSSIVHFIWKALIHKGGGAIDAPSSFFFMKAFNGWQRGGKIAGPLIFISSRSFISREKKKEGA